MTKQLPKRGVDWLYGGGRASRMSSLTGSAGVAGGRVVYDAATFGSGSVQVLAADSEA